MRTISHYLTYLATIALLSGCFFNGKELQRWSISPEGATSFALSRDGRFALLYSKEQDIVLWDLEQNKKLAQLGQQDAENSAVSHIKISDNNRYAVTASQQNFAVWDLAWSQSEGLWSITDSLIRDIDISNNGEKVLLGLSNGKAIYVDLGTGRRLEFLAHREKVNSVSLSANGRYALSGGNDYFAYLWDTTTGQIIHAFEHTQRINRVVLQRDGKLAFTADGGNDGQIWDLKTGAPVSKLKTFSRQQIFSTARFSDDGSKLITGTPASRIMLWDTQSGKKIGQWEAEALKDARPATAVVYDVAIDSQHRVISGTSAGIAQAWLVE